MQLKVPGNTYRLATSTSELAQNPRVLESQLCTDIPSFGFGHCF